MSRLLQITPISQLVSAVLWVTGLVFFVVAGTLYLSLALIFTPRRLLPVGRLACRALLLAAGQWIRVRDAFPMRSRSVDAVVCDPPSFIPGKKDVSAGLRAYRTLFAHVLRKVRPGGFAVLASCSHHLYEDRFARVVSEASRWSDTQLKLVIRGDQSPCHPVPLAFPEARYLKCWLVQVEPR